jgi:hypothetical protein
MRPRERHDHLHPLPVMRSSREAERQHVPVLRREGAARKGPGSASGRGTAVSLRPLRGGCGGVGACDDGLLLVILSADGRQRGHILSASVRRESRGRLRSYGRRRVRIQLGWVDGGRLLDSRCRRRSRAHRRRLGRRRRASHGRRRGRSLTNLRALAAEIGLGWARGPDYGRFGS